MADLLKSSSLIRTIISADIFNAKTDVAHQHKEDNNNNVKNNGSSTVIFTPPRAINSRVSTTIPKMSILFNELTDIKVGYLGKF